MNACRFQESQGFHWLAYTAVAVVLIGALVASAVAFIQTGESRKLGEA